MRVRGLGSCRAEERACDRCRDAPADSATLNEYCEREVGAERLTRLDRSLIGRAEDGVVDLRMNGLGADYERTHNQLRPHRLTMWFFFQQKFGKIIFQHSLKQCLRLRHDSCM